MKDADENGREHHAEGPHAEAAHDHRILHVPCCPQPVRSAERRRPDKRLDDRDPAEHEDAHRRGLRVHARKPRHRTADRIRGETGGQNHAVAVKGKPDNIVFCLLHAARADALANNRHQPDADPDAADAVQVLEDHRHRLRRDRGGAKRRNARLDGELAELKHPVLNAARHSDRENPDNHLKIGPDSPVVFQNDGLRLVRAREEGSAEAEEDNRHTENTAEGRGKRRAEHAPLKSEDKDRVSDDVHDIRDHGHSHREAAVAARAVEGRSNLKQRDKRIGQRGDPEIGLRILHHGRLHGAEDKAEERPPRDEADRHDAD